MLWSRMSLGVMLLLCASGYMTAMLPGQVSRIPSVVPEESKEFDDEHIKMQAKLRHAQNALEGLVVHVHGLDHRAPRRAHGEALRAARSGDVAGSRLRVHHRYR